MSERQAREARLAAQLRANLKRRKQRVPPTADAAPGDDPAAPPGADPSAA